MSIGGKLKISFAALINIFMVAGCKFNDKEKKTDIVNDKAGETTNKYNALRQQAFTVTTENLGIKLKDSLEVYGLIMDWGIDDEVATVVSYASGDASLYLSSGGGIIGGGSHENIDVAAKGLVYEANHYLEGNDTTVEKFAMPGKDEVFFYFITQKGVYMKHDNMTNLENRTSEVQFLFDKGNIVLEQLRLIGDNY
ncbi:hypothetical protein [Flavobacterium coralii]|uniref:hypothetical protein n=1 Tax=Flavobacterium coralii TaxID=2838017 RepID=UPI000C692C5B|nr:hypothetical protein [Flavobacterium sp.]|tara:strand:+ start:277 stop:864 length:588 start_codon:yes stop_codon:yes gene_type:complete